MAGYVSNKDDILSRLRRIEGQIRGLQRMVDNDTYCIDVLTQVSAATRALRRVRGRGEGQGGVRGDRPAGAVLTYNDDTNEGMGAMTDPAVYTVSGMTCAHCVSAVTEEVSRLAGVTNVEVDLQTGRVRVASAAPLAESDVRAAVEAAGYELTGTPG